MFEPHTAADGVAEIKAFINGTHVKHFLRLRTIIAKVVGTILTAASGLTAGAEGPLIHIGAGVGSGMPVLVGLFYYSIRSLLTLVRTWDLRGHLLRQDAQLSPCKCQWVSFGYVLGLF